MMNKVAERSVNSLYHMPIERITNYLKRIHQAEQKMIPGAKIMVFQTFAGGPPSPQLVRLKQKLRVLQAQKANLQKAKELKTPFNIDPYLDYV